MKTNLVRVNNPFSITQMEPYTLADLKLERKAYATEKARTFVKDAVENIYYGVRKVSVERISHSFYYNVYHDDKYIDIDHLATSIREDLVTLFPDFQITIGNVNDGYNRSRYIHVTW